MEFYYNGVTTYNDSIHLDSYGNIALDVTDAMDRHHYLVVRTALGESSCLEWGPIYPDEELLPGEHTISFKRIEYSEKALQIMIKKFLQPKKLKGNAKAKIVKVEKIDVDLALSYGINPFKYLSEFSDDSNY